MSAITLEVVCGSAWDALEASRGGADRVELCSALFLGGLTPSIGALKAVRKESALPLYCMLRPREASFCYTDFEYKVMKEDAEELLAAGADGLVLGLLTQDNKLDLERLRDFRESFPEAKLVFHRAFDIVKNWRQAMDNLIQLGFVRILTSGQAPNVLVGMDIIKEMIDYAAGRIEIMPGGGVKRYILQELIARTGCNSVHMNLRRTEYDHSGDNINGIHFGGGLFPAENSFTVIDHSLVAEIKNNF